MTEIVRENRMLFGMSGAIATVAVAVLASWINVNSRISVLEIQMKEAQKQVDISAQNMEEIRNSISDIKTGIQHLQDIKADK